MSRGVKGSTPGHGTVARYRHGCRCEACRAAHARRQNYYRLSTTPRMVPRDGTERRLQALACMGWPRWIVAQRLGVTTDAVDKFMRREGPVQVDTAARVRRVYDQLSMTRGPSALVRTRALRRGWAPPLAWDDDVIDDPNAEPEGAGWEPPSVIEQIRDLEERGLNRTQIAKERGVSRAAIDQACSRAARRENAA